MDDQNASTPPSRFQLTSAIQRYADWAIRQGTNGYDRETRRRLSICNIAGYLSALSSISFAINFALYDMVNLKWLILGNLVSALLTMTAPYWHRYNAVASPIILATTVAITLFFFISELGRSSGIQLNYIGSVAIAFAIFGLGHMRYVIGVSAICVLGHLSTYFLFEKGRVEHVVDPGFLTQIYVLSAVSIMIVLGLIVWYAFSIAAAAEARSEQLLNNVLPSKIADQLRDHPDSIIADKFDEASVMFADIVGFTALARKLPAEDLIAILNRIFSKFDQIGAEIGTEKIKTIGDSYMAVSGIPQINEHHARDIVRLAVRFLEAMEELSEEENIDLRMRIGVATGPITAGVIGKAKFAYDVWSSTVNLASRLETFGTPGRIRVSQATRQALKDEFEFEKIPAENLKGVGRVASWYLVRN